MDGQIKESPVARCLFLRPYILSTIFLNILNKGSSCNMSTHVTRPYKTKRLVLLYQNQSVDDITRIPRRWWEISGSAAVGTIISTTTATNSTWIFLPIIPPLHNVIVIFIV
jgi:hypothetical protein